jgi:hypothetical protein
MPDFNPVEEAKRIVSVYKRWHAGEPNMRVLVDYIDALVKALRETDEAMHALDRNDIMQIVSSANVELLSHTNRHLLEG